MAPYRWILFADLDGTVLDKETYEPGPSLEALGKCREEGLHVIFSSSKTGSEIEVYHTRYAPHPTSPFIAENGGGVFFPLHHWAMPSEGVQSGRFWKVILGADHGEVLRVLREAARRTGTRIRAFSDMTSEEIAHTTGLCPEEAELARQRDFDEPFWIEEDDPAKRERLQKEIERQGMRLTRGGRCLHVHGKSDKGRATVYVRQRYERAEGYIRTAAVGDAANDLPMFMAVDRAYLVKGVDARHDPDIPREANIRFLPGVGPAGFFQAVEDLLHPRQEG